MERVFYFSKENGKKAEEILKKDDKTSRGSITLKDAKSLGVDTEGYFLIYEGDEEKIRRAEELVKELEEKIEEEKKEEALKKYKEESEKALEGFGGIFG